MKDGLVKEISLKYDVRDIDDSLINYLGSDIQYNLDVMAVDAEKIVFEDKNINKKICIKWASILGDSDGYIPNDKGKVRFVPNKEKWFNSFGKYDFGKDNPGLEFYPYKGFYFKSYAEFFINDDSLKVYWNAENIEFSIGEVKVKVGSPTNIFKLINNHFYEDIQYKMPWYGEWERFLSISFTGIKKEEVENYLQQAMYIISLNNSALSSLTVGFDYRSWEEDEKGIFIKNGKSYKVAAYSDVINFYNEARKPGSLDKALNYYKVLEYFFIINRENEILSAVDKYNKMGNKADLISSMSKIAKENEEINLKLLIERIYPKINGIIQDAFEKNLIKENSYLAFAEELYSVRNDFVHAKQNHRKFEVWVPSILKEDEKYEWIHILGKVAIACIEEFCFE